MIIPAWSGSPAAPLRAPARRGLPAPALRASDRRDSLRALVDREEAADPVTGAVGVIEARFPQRAAGEAVELAAARALGEQGGGDRNVALENTREPVAHLVGRLADRHRAGDVGGAIDILAAGVDQVERALFELAVGLLARAIVD